MMTDWLTMRRPLALHTATCRSQHRYYKAAIVGLFKYQLYRASVHQSTWYCDRARLAGATSSRICKGGFCHLDKSTPEADLDEQRQERSHRIEIIRRRYDKNHRVMFTYNTIQMIARLHFIKLVFPFVTNHRKPRKWNNHVLEVQRYSSDQMCLCMLCRKWSAMLMIQIN